MFFWGANTWILLETAEFRNREGRLSEDPGYHRIELWVFKNFEAHPTEKCVSSFQASNEEISHSQSFHCGKWTRASWWDSADSLDGCCTPKPMPSHSKCWEPIGPAFKPREGLQSFHPKKKRPSSPKTLPHFVDTKCCCGIGPTTPAATCSNWSLSIDLTFSNPHLSAPLREVFIAVLRIVLVDAKRGKPHILDISWPCLNTLC
jgi:hypothetical protein